MRLPPPSGSRLPRRLPVALLYLSGPDLASRSWDALATRLRELLPGVEPLSPQLLHVSPAQGDAAVFDRAAAAAISLLAHGGDPHLPATAELRLLVAPGEVETMTGAARLVSDEPVDRALGERPELPVPPGVYLTSRAARAVEGSWRLEPAEEWRTPVGTTVPLERVAGWSAAARPPFRNPSLFGRAHPYVGRPQVEEQVVAGLEAGRFRLAGPLGAGKGRVLWESLSRRIVPTAWAGPGRAGVSMAEALLRRGLAAVAHPALAGVEEKLRLAGAGRSALAADLLLGWLTRQLARADGPAVAVVCDDMQDAGEEELTVVGRLLALSPDPRRMLLVLVGRDGTEWPEAAAVLPRLELPACDEATMQRIAGHLSSGLEMPRPVVDRFVAASAGRPFCFEEGLVHLIHQRTLRRIYGNFFFGGDSQTPYTPSHRLAAHLVADAERLGSPGPLLALAAADRAVPPGALAAAAEACGAPASPGWLERTQQAGWTRLAPGPWGEGVELAFPVAAGALAASLAPAAADALRHAVGREVLAGGGDTEASWQTYRLLSGSPEAAPALLATMRPLPPESRREEVFASLRDELATLRRGHGSESAELDLLWALLPLARRLGRLREVAGDLERARLLTGEQPDKALAVATLQAELEVDEGRPRVAERHLRRALELAVAHDHRRKHLLALQLGRLLIRGERPAEARDLLERLLPELSRPGSAALAATCRFLLGNVALAEDRPDEALALHRQALAERERQGLAGPAGASLCAIGAACVRQGDYAGALDSFSRAVDLLEGHGREGETTFALGGLGVALCRLGDATGATRHLRGAIAQRAGRDGAFGEALCRLALAENLLDLQQVGEALDEARMAHFQLSLLEESSALGDAERLVGRCLLARRQHEAARLHLRRALAVHRRHRRPREAAIDTGWLLEEALDRQDREEVEILVRQLADALDGDDYPDRGELLDLQLFRALEWLAGLGSLVPAPPLRFLRRAYRELLRKTGFLDPEQRSTFLFQIPEHRAIVEAATRHHLSLPGLVR